MKFIGFNFTKVSVERFKEISKEVKISTNIAINSVKEAKTSILRLKEDVLSVDFTYSILYSPEIASIELKGTLLISVEGREAKEILKSWKEKENEKINDFRVFTLNIILRKSNIKSLELEEEFNLIPHVPLPSVNNSNFEKKE